MADFIIEEPPDTASKFDIQEPPSQRFVVEEPANDWAKNVVGASTQMLPREAGIRTAKQTGELVLPQGYSEKDGRLVLPRDAKMEAAQTATHWYDRPLEITSDVLSMPGDYLRGVLTGKPGERVGPEKIFNADTQSEPENFAVRYMAGTLVDPLTALGALPMRKVPRPAAPTYQHDIFQGPMPMQGPPEFIGPQPRNLGQPADLGNLIRPVNKPSAEPTVTELAQDSQFQPSTSPAGAFSEGMLETPMRRSPESIAGRTGPDMVPPQTESLGFPTTERDRARYNKEMTVEFEKPGFLRSAEEKVQDRNPLRPAEDMAPTGPAQGRAFERSRRELEAAEAERVATREKARAVLREQMNKMNTPKQEWQGPPSPPKPKTEFMDSPAQAGFTMDPNGEVIIGDGALPSGANRFVHKALDTLGMTGPTGQALKSLLYGMDDYARQATATNFADWVREIQKVYPANRKPGVLRDPRREWSVRDYINISDKEYDALVDLWYSNGQYRANFDKLDPAAKIRVEAAFPTWKTSFGRASSDPGVQGLTVKNSVTGVETPVGSPSSFLPHQYRGGVDTGKFSKTLLNRIYRQYAQNTATPMTQSEFLETFRKRVQGYESVPTPDGKGTKWIRTSNTKRFLGVEEARLFDAAEVAKEEGKSIRQVLEEHGLETDVVKLQLRYNLGALHRGQQQLHKTTLDKMWANWREEVDHDPVADAWGTTLEERYKGMTVHEDIDRVNAEWLQKLKGINALTLLPRATVAASNQFFTYGLSKPTWRGLLDRMTARAVQPDELARAQALIPDSGALLANFSQEMNRIDGLFGAWSMAQLRLTGFNYLDRVQRQGAAKIGFFYAKDLGRKLMKDPTDQVVRNQLINDLRVNPDEVLASMKRTGTISDEVAKRAMQVYSDTSMGTTGIRGKPMWATSDHWAPQMMLNLRGQMVSNMTEAYRMVFHAPNLKTGIDKAARLLLGAAVAGTTTRAIGDALRGQVGELQGSTKDLKKRLGDETFAVLVDGIVYGLGTIATDTALMGIAPGDDVRWKFASGLIGTPMTQIGRAAKLYKDATTDPLRGVLKTVPFPVPLDVMAEEAGVLKRKPKRRDR